MIGVDGFRLDGRVAIVTGSGRNIGRAVAEGFAACGAKVVVNGIERAMVTPQTLGDCNACHTQNGLQGAPGRIIVP